MSILGRVGHYRCTTAVRQTLPVTLTITILLHGRSWHSSTVYIVLDLLYMHGPLNISTLLSIINIIHPLPPTITHATPQMSSHLQTPPETGPEPSHDLVPSHDICDEEQDVVEDSDSDDGPSVRYTYPSPPLVLLIFTFRGGCTTLLVKLQTTFSRYSFPCSCCG